MTFCNLPDSLDLGGENANVDPDILEEIRKKDPKGGQDGIQHPNPGKPGDMKKALGPKIVEVPVLRQPTAHAKKVWSDVNAASRDIVFHLINVAGETTPHLKRFRDNMEKSESLKDLLGARLSIANYNDLTQTGALILSSYLKSLTPPKDAPQASLHLQGGPPPKRQHVLPG